MAIIGNIPYFQTNPHLCENEAITVTGTTFWGTHDQFHIGEAPGLPKNGKRLVCRYTNGEA